MDTDTSAQLAGVAIKLAISEQNFTITDLLKEIDRSVNHDQAHQVLKQLEQDGWIDRSNRTERNMWKSGSLALKYGDMVTYSMNHEGKIPVLPDEGPN